MANAKIKLSKKPKGVTIIEGFPGFGLVATIATGYLLDHLKCEQIGKYFFEDAPATLAIHGCKLIDPIGVYYCKDYNIVLIHAISSPIGIEWKSSDLVLDICSELDAKEVISLEGVGSTEDGERVFFFTNTPAKAKKFESLGYKCIGEGIIVGVTAALLQKVKRPMSCLFAETHSQLPDSKAAASVVEALDKYLGLKVDTKPLLKQAEEFEEKLKKLMEQATQAKDVRDKKQLSYVG